MMKILFCCFILWLFLSVRGNNTEDSWASDDFEENVDDLFHQHFELREDREEKRLDHDEKREDHDQKRVDHDEKREDHDEKRKEHDEKREERDKKRKEHDEKREDHDEKRVDHDEKRGEHDKKRRDHDAQNNKDCNTPACKLLKESVRSTMSNKYKPCDDMYMYSCGGMIDREKKRTPERDRSTFRILIEAQTNKLIKVVEALKGRKGESLCLLAHLLHLGLFDIFSICYQ